MPRENRKRGKRHKKNGQEYDEQEAQPEVIEPVAGPSWIVQKPDTEKEVDTEAPFGYVDADVKAYFRTVDAQMRDWQTNETEVPEEEDPNEVRRMFFVAALQEMSGKEKQLATDPDCSIILERMIHSMDDFARRVLVDRFCGSYEVLAKHRFASHVCQTLLAVSGDTVAREFLRGGAGDAHPSEDSEELRAMAQLIIDICDELKPSLMDLVMDQFASHVIQTLLLVLTPSARRDGDSDVRSKKSAAWKARQGPLKSVFTDRNDAGKASSKSKAVPTRFREVALQFLQLVKDTWSENEVRSMATNKYATPLLKAWLEIESELDKTNMSGSLLDMVSHGLVTFLEDEQEQPQEPSDYVNALLRDPTSSHLMEALVTCSPPRVFDLLWSLYFEKQIERVALHPVANFVVAKAMSKLSKGQVATTCQNLSGSWKRIISSSRAGVLKEMINRCIALRSSEDEISEAVISAFDISEDEDRRMILPCVLRLMSLPDYKEAVKPEQKKEESSGEHRRRKDTDNGGTDPKVPGALLFQSLLRLSHPCNDIYIQSIRSLSVEELISIAHHPVSSRVIDAFLESDTVPFKTKRDFLLSLIGHYHILVDDRIGSRVGDRCWAFADTYLKEKIARSLFPHEQALFASFYGKFFSRNVNLNLLRRRPDEWKTMQSKKGAGTMPTTKINTPAIVPTIDGMASSQQPSTGDQKPSKAKRKRKAETGDDIDAVFDAALGKRIKKGALGIEPNSDPVSTKSSQKQKEPPQDLNTVLNAIRAAPKGEDRAKRRKHK